jgi:hypothetical protein
MHKASDYRRFAAECMEIAYRMSANGNRARMMEMAQRWLDLAQKAEAENSAPRRKSDETSCAPKRI